jgi:hypothetical protein
MAKEQGLFGASRGLGPHVSRRGMLQAGLAIGTLGLGQRAALGQPGHAHHTPESAWRICRLCRRSISR